MSPVAAPVVEDLSVTPDPRFRPLVDVLARLAEADDGVGRLEVVVQDGGQEALRARVQPEASASDAPLVAICGSAFKPALALCLLQVLHRAGIHPDEPLAGHGVDLADGRTTGRHVVEHRAGLPHVRDVAPEVGALGDGPAITAALRRTSPLWDPGTRSAYHAVSYGYLVGAVCEDLTSGASMTSLLRDVVLDPAGIGSDEVALPGEEGSTAVADLFVTGTSPLPWRPQGRSLIYRSLYFLPELVEHLNSPAGRVGPPLSCGVPCTASALAGLYGALIAPSSARPGFPDEVRTAMATDSGPAFDQVMRQRLTWSGGTLVGAGLRRLLDRPGLVGLPGYGGSMGLGDPASGISLGIISTRLDADRIVGRDAEAICDAVLTILDG